MDTAIQAERWAASAHHYIVGVNMMCALGVPGNMIHGWFPFGLVESPVLSGVAYGM